MYQIDINCDMGEGLDNETQLMPYISSANIACGGHAGDDDIIKKTIELALQNNVAIGAHPSYPDRENFGRIDLLDTDIFIDDLKEIILGQLAKLDSACREAGTHLHHIKLHGALYNRAAWDHRIGSILAEIISEHYPAVKVYGLSGSEMEEVIVEDHIRFINEVFADRNYEDDGSLVSRKKSNSLIADYAEVGERVYRMIEKNSVISVTGNTIPIKAETVCIHGDGASAEQMAKSLHAFLLERKVAIRPPL